MEINEKNPNPIKDQHFMIDKDLLRQIGAICDIEENESIIEIGGGEGALTDQLIKSGGFITIIEKDPYYAEYLRKKYDGNKKIQIIEGDALNFEYNCYDKIIANLPYTITEPFLINLAKSGALDVGNNNKMSTLLKNIVFVLSQNSVRKMVAPIQSSSQNDRHMNAEFGTMSAICKAFCDIDIIRTIPSKSFFPEPAVTSFLVKITPRRTKNTVEFIMREMLMDRKGIRPTIKKVYQTLLAQNRIYKTSKYGNQNPVMTDTSFITKQIANSNFYDLSNEQISLLFQTLIRNDIKVKGQKQRYVRPGDYDLITSETLERNYQYDNKPDDYFVDKNQISDKQTQDDELYSLDDELYENSYTQVIKQTEKNKKYLEKYKYFYEEEAYKLLLKRNLEYLPPDSFQQMLHGEKYPLEEVK